MVTVVTGARGSGKTSLASAFWREAREARGAPWAGFLSLRSGPGEPAPGYDAFCLRRELRHPLLRLRPSGAAAPHADAAVVGDYQEAPGAFAALNRWGMEGVREGSPVLLLDEVGRLELSGCGWAPLLRQAMAAAPTLGHRLDLLVVVRGSCRADVQEAFGLRAARVLDLGELCDRAVELVRRRGACGPRELGRLAGGGQQVGEALAAALLRSGMLREERGAYHPAGIEAEANLSPLGKRLLSLLRAAGEGAVDPREAGGAASAEEASRLVRLGLAVPVGRRLLSVRGASAIAARLYAALASRGEVEISELRPHVALARQELLDLLALLEASGAVRAREGRREFVSAPGPEELATAAARRQDGAGSPGGGPRRRARR